MPRVAIVTNVLSHYRVPCFQKLCELMPGQVTFFVLSERMDHRSYVMADGHAGLPVVSLAGVKWPRPPYDDVHLSDVRPLLRGDFETVVLGAWSEPTYLVLWLARVLARRRLLFWIESTARDMARSRLREGIKRILLGRASGCIVPGTRAREYCRMLGVPDEEITVAPNATDRGYFRAQADRLLPARESLRQAEGLSGFVVLFVGRLVERLKGVSTLISACAELGRAGATPTLLVAGDGPDRREYEKQALREGLTSIRFLGTLQHDDLCRYYACADVLALPSRSEPWGFVLNEGMEFGLPLVISDAVGAGPDLVHAGRNGLVVPAGEAAPLSRALGDLAADPSRRRVMGQASRQMVEQFSPEHWAQAVARALRARRGAEAAPAVVGT